MQIVIIVATFSPVFIYGHTTVVPPGNDQGITTIYLTNYGPCDRLQNTETNPHLNCIKYESLQARTPCAKNGCGIIVRYCYASEFSGCYFPV
jgi:hypothetical protein